MSYNFWERKKNHDMLKGAARMSYDDYYATIGWRKGAAQIEKEEPPIFIPPKPNPAAPATSDTAKKRRSFVQIRKERAKKRQLQEQSEAARAVRALYRETKRKAKQQLEEKAILGTTAPAHIPTGPDGPGDGASKKESPGKPQKESPGKPQKEELRQQIRRLLRKILLPAALCSCPACGGSGAAVRAAKSGKTGETACQKKQAGRAASIGYREHARSLIATLRQKGNAELLSSVCSGALAPALLVRTPLEELAPEHIRQMREQNRKRSIQEVNVTVAMVKTLEVCTKCKAGGVLADVSAVRSGQRRDIAKAETWGSKDEGADVVCKVQLHCQQRSCQFVWEITHLPHLASDG
eukprot:g65633.t1